MRPEFWFNDLGVDRVNSFVHAMAAAEGLLLPPRSEARGGPGLTVTFGRHAAVLASPSREDLSDRADDLSSLYRLRSRLVHGEMNPNSLEAGDVERLRLGLSFFRFALIRILGLGNTGRLDGTSLPVVLARAWLDPAAHASLFKAPEGP
jgi:hypothetical protein